MTTYAYLRVSTDRQDVANQQLDAHADDIRRYLAKGISQRSIAKLVGCAESTLYDWLTRRHLPIRSPVTDTRS